MSQGSGCYLTEKPNLGLTKSILFLASFTFLFDSSLGSTFALFLLARGQLVSVNSGFISLQDRLRVQTPGGGGYGNPTNQTAEGNQSSSLNL